MVRYVPEADLLLAPPLVGSATSQARAFTSETVLSGPIPMCRYRGGMLVVRLDGESPVLGSKGYFLFAQPNWEDRHEPSCSSGCAFMRVVQRRHRSGSKNPKPMPKNLRVPR